MTTFLAAVFSTFAVALGGSSTNPTTKFVSASITSPQAMRLGRPCRKTFTLAMTKRADIAVYRGTRDVSRRELRMLARIDRCQRNPKAISYARKLTRHARHDWYLRRNPPLRQALASWYDDAGATACGFHAFYGVANKSLPCGTHVLVRYHGRQLTMIVQDRGPYVGGREWDLNQNTAGALGFSGVDTIWVDH